MAKPLLVVHFSRLTASQHSRQARIIVADAEQSAIAIARTDLS
jgi:hypothetical protein